MIKGMRNKIVNLVPFDEPSYYVDAYLKLYPSLNVIRSKKALLTLPFRSVVIIEDIHKWAVCYLLRIDLHIVHVPRGGCSFKIGWLDTNPHFFIWIKAWRRNAIVVGSEFFKDYVVNQDRLKFWQSIIYAEEPISKVYRTLKSCKDSHDVKKTILIMLGDRATEEDYRRLSTLDFGKYTVKYSIHPRLKLKRKSDIWHWEEISTVITDGSVSISLFLESCRIKHIVIADLCCSRKMWINKEEIYSNMIPLHELCEAVGKGETSNLEFELTTSDLLEQI